MFQKDIGLSPHVITKGKKSRFKSDNPIRTSARRGAKYLINKVKSTF